MNDRSHARPRHHASGLWALVVAVVAVGSSLASGGSKGSGFPASVDLAPGGAGATTPAVPPAGGNEPTSIPSTPPAAPSESATPGSNDSPSLGVGATLVLLNNSVVPGDFLVGNSLDPFALAYDAHDGEVFVGARGCNLCDDPYVTVVNDSTGSVVGSVPLDGPPGGLAYDPASGEVFVNVLATLFSGPEVVAISTATDGVVATLPVTPYGDPGAIVYDSGAKEVFVAGDSGGATLLVISGDTDAVVATIPLWAESEGLAYDPNAGTVFVADPDAANISVVSDATNSVVATVTVGAPTYAAVYDAGTDQVFFTGTNGNVTVVNATSYAVVTTIPLAGFDNQIAYDGSSGDVDVGSPNLVSIISDTNDSVLSTVPVTGEAAGLAFDAGRGELFVANTLSDALTEISDTTGQVTGSMALGTTPLAEAYAPGPGNGPGTLWVTQDVGDVYAISDATDRIAAVVTTGSCPCGAAYDSGAGELFVTNDNSQNVSILSEATRAVVATVSVGTGPFGVAYDPARGEVFVANSGSDNVSVINDTNDSVVATIPVGTDPSAIAYDGPDHELFVANEGSRNVSVLSDALNTVVGSIGVGGGPAGVAYDPDRAQLFVANLNSGNVSIVSTSSDHVVASVTTGSSPHQVAYDPQSGEVFVTNGPYANVTVISGATDRAVAEISVGGAPWGVLVDPFTGTVWVANADQGTLSAIVGTTSIDSITFTEQGLPLTGRTWSVNLNGVTKTSSAANITFTLPDREYLYLVEGPLGYRIWNVAPDGVVAVSGPGTVVNVPFIRGATDTLTFREIGLTPFSPWCVDLALYELCSYQTRIAFHDLSPGSYQYAVQAVNGTTQLQRLVGSSVIPNGTVRVAGDEAIVVRYAYPVLVTEEGIPPGTDWGVTIAGTNVRSTGSTILVELTNGTYRFRLDHVPGYLAVPTSGTVTVAGHAKGIGVIFVVVSPRGLPLRSGIGPAPAPSLPAQARRETPA
jgi:YVTN family beta-propeller protein